MMKTQRRKNPAAVALGRLGGIAAAGAGGRARFAKLTPAERSAVARHAVLARFAKLTPSERSAIARKAAKARVRTRPG
jgi:hypothetical protein